MPDKQKEYIIRKDFLITSADVDFEGLLRISSLTNFFIQSAWQHAEHLGWGVNDLLKRNLAWVLSGFKIEIINYPKWEQTITIETWPKGINRLFYLRDFNVFDKQNNLVARATTNWLLIDIDKRRPKLIEIDSDTFKKNLDRHAIEQEILKPEQLTTIHSSFPFEVRYSNLDINQHLTTTAYIDFIFDSYNPEFISKNRPESIVAFFVREVKYGENIRMNRSEIDNKKHLFQLESADSKMVFFHAELNF